MTCWWRECEEPEPHVWDEWDTETACYVERTHGCVRLWAGRGDFYAMIPVRPAPLIVDWEGAVERALDCEWEQWCEQWYKYSIVGEPDPEQRALFDRCRRPLVEKVVAAVAGVPTVRQVPIVVTAEQAEAIEAAEAETQRTFTEVMAAHHRRIDLHIMGQDA